MYPGHFTTALLMRRAEPRAPLLGLLVGVGLLDMLFAVFLIAGLEGGNELRLFVPWSHSLAMAVGWAALYALLFHRHGQRVMAWMAAAVLSHWVLDVFVHRPALGLWPHSGIELGFQSVFGGLAGWLEAGVTFGGLTLYVIAVHRSPLPRPRWWAGVFLISVLFALEFALARNAP